MCLSNRQSEISPNLYHSGLQLLTSVIVADITTLRWRGLVQGLTTAPFIINAFVGANVAADVIKSVGWRWGYGMSVHALPCVVALVPDSRRFAIMTPIITLPIILTLAWGQRRAKQLGVLATSYYGQQAQAATGNHKSFLTKAREFALDIDLLGLALFTIGWGLLLIPLTIVNGGKQKWSSGDIIAMLTLGPIILVRSWTSGMGRMLIVI